MKKLISLLLALVLILALTPAMASEEPIVVKFWHGRGTGAQYDCVLQAVNSFNETVGKEKGIFVEESYIGGYVDLFAQIQLAVQSNESPNIVGIAGAHMPYMLEDELAVNMAPLAEADGFDLIGNQLPALLEIGGNQDGDMYSVGYCRSTPLFYYNKGITREAGIEFGEMVTMDEIKEWGEKVVLKDENGNTTRYAFLRFNDFAYCHVNHIYQLGSTYLSDDGSGSPCLEDGTMLKVLTDWRDSIDAGWCMPFAANNPSDVAFSMFASGDLVGCVASCAGLSTFRQIAETEGIELGIAMYPTYDVNNHRATIGGASLCIIGAENSEEEIKASWEFIKHTLADEQTYYNSSNSSYIPTTISITEYEPMLKFWEEVPSYKHGYDQMLKYGHCEELPSLPFAQDFTQIVWDVCSLLIAEQSITPEEAVEMIKVESEDLWV